MSLEVLLRACGEAMEEHDRALVGDTGVSWPLLGKAVGLDAFWIHDDCVRDELVPSGLGGGVPSARGSCNERGKGKLGRH